MKTTEIIPNMVISDTKTTSGYNYIFIVTLKLGVLQGWEQCVNYKKTQDKHNRAWLNCVESRWGWLLITQ